MDEDLIRLELQRVAFYREVCRGVRRSSGSNLFFAAIMLFLSYVGFNARGGAADPAVAVFALLAMAELVVGLMKWLHPSAEGVLLDGLVLLLFAGSNLTRAALGFLAGRPRGGFSVVFGVYILLTAIARFRTYADLRRTFRDRPPRDRLAWFDGLVREVRAGRPDTDPDALDLPTKPPMKAKLLGRTGFLVETKGESVWVVGPDDFGLSRDATDGGLGRRTALMWVHGQAFAPFPLDDASWSNYEAWMKAAGRADALRP